MSTTPRTRSNAPIDLTLDDLDDGDSTALVFDAHDDDPPASTSDTQSKPSNEQLVRDILEEVWEDFIINWKKYHNLLVVGSLKDPHEFCTNDENDSLTASHDDDDDMGLSSSDTDDAMDLVDVYTPHKPHGAHVRFADTTRKINIYTESTTGAGPSTVTIEPIRTITLPVDTSNDPSFEAYQPANVCIGVDIPATEDYIPDFIPYADEEEFDQEEYLNHYKEFGWQDMDSNDPDLIEVYLETVRRLYYGHTLSLEDIEKTEVLPPLRTPKSGILRKAARKDLIQWPNGRTTGYLPPVSELFKVAFPVPEVRSKAAMKQPAFCPHPNCLDVACPTHHKLYADMEPRPRVPTISSINFQASKGNACGQRCFRHAVDTTEELVHWQEDDVNDLSEILRVFPDATPCDLAIMVHKPCMEVFFQRRILIPDSSIRDLEGRPVPATSSIFGRKPQFQDDIAYAHNKYVRVPPCDHPGEHCNTARCGCYEAEQHCIRMCKCIDDCERRFKPCKCHPHKRKSRRKVCDTNSTCSCRAHGRECDPERCRCCPKIPECPKGKGKKAKKGPDFNPCLNMKIQEGIGADLEIREGTWGFGAFATTRIPRNGYIGEYTGELRKEHGGAKDPWKHEHEYRDRNYLFGVNDRDTVDGTRVGNELRFINHADPPNANVDAQLILVNGDQRISLTAGKEIKQGQELFLDYGKDYWPKPDAAGDVSTATIGDVHGDQTDEDSEAGEEYIEERVDEEEDDVYVPDEQSDEDYRF